MYFAGNNYAYISQRKVEKINNLNNHKDNMKVESEDIKYKNEMVIEEELNEIDDLKIELKCKKSLRKNRSRDRSIDRMRRRSRSNSMERNDDAELDMVYSDEEEIENDFHQQVMNNDLGSNKKEGFFGNLGNKLKGLFSAPKKEKKVLYQVSQLQQEGKKEYEHEVDTNVLAIEFGFLKDKVEGVTGDPINCKCESVFNKHSTLEKIEGSGKSLWSCEFCGEKNEIYIEPQEIPSTDCVDYLVQSVGQLKGSKYNYNDEQTLIYCFDISGSMCVTSPISGKHKIKGNNLDKNLKDLMAFSDGSDQFYQSGDRNITYISRLQCLQAAIESSLGDLLKASPNRKVGFVAFNNEVIGLGDGSKNIVKINGNNLNEYETIKTIAEKNQEIISTPLKDGYYNLIKLLYSLEENGQTSLGPAILFSINLINEVSPGSRIILCTDGISNTGIGSMEVITEHQQIKDLKDFYTNLGVMAKEKGIIIDLITFEGANSNIEVLMAMIDQTGGEIMIVKPQEILTQFGNLLQNELVATQVKIKIKLHKLMKFRNEDNKDLNKEGTTLSKEIGNATKETELGIEYTIKKSSEIAAECPGIDLNSIKFVPFQCIIDYMNKKGERWMRVTTKTQELCSDKEVIQNKANYDIISTNAIQKTSKLAKDGNYREAQSNALAWKKMMKHNTNANQNAHDNYHVFSHNMANFNNNLQKMQWNNMNQNVISDNQPLYGNINSNVKNNTNVNNNIKSDELSQQIHSLKNISKNRAMNSKKK